MEELELAEPATTTVEGVDFTAATTTGTGTGAGVGAGVATVGVGADFWAVSATNPSPHPLHRTVEPTVVSGTLYCLPHFEQAMITTALMYSSSKNPIRFDLSKGPYSGYIRLT